MKVFKRMKGFKRSNLIKYSAVVVLMCLLSRCVYLDDVIQPSSVNAGDSLKVTLKVRVDAAEDAAARLIIGFLAPKSWNAGANSTFTIRSSFGVRQMSRVPAGTIATNGNGLEWPAALRNRYGIGGNLIDDVEWVVYWSDEVFDIKNGNKISADVEIVTKTGPENMLVKLGYFVGESRDGLTSDARYNKISFSDCFSVTNGEGDLVDFCNPQLAYVDPAKSTDNDIITINFDSEVAATPLTGNPDIFMCATGYTADGQAIEVCNRDITSKLRVSGVNRFKLNFWPRQYFNLTEEQTLTRIEYFFTSRDGSIKVGYSGTSDPFIYTFKCD